jgi:DNA-directed RNA polymerase omega subunit
MKRETPVSIEGTTKHIPNVYEAVLCTAQRARELQRNKQKDCLTKALLDGEEGNINRQEYLMKSVIEQLTKEKKDGKRSDPVKPS